ncbi:unnamed protein product [Rotaria magnacalcarata]|uniref:Uncharacterized protein n=1 Tax=Rotaria magnacalcarata TaxID=392030 RepID=A0A8S3DKQ1_9BILA|nr:unnamed protein product [Rotaria magnacalcarata]
MKEAEFRFDSLSIHMNSLKTNIAVATEDCIEVMKKISYDNLTNSFVDLVPSLSNGIPTNLHYQIDSFTKLHEWFSSENPSHFINIHMIQPITNMQIAPNPFLLSTFGTRNYLLNVETITKVNFQAYNDAADLLSHFKIKNGLDTKKITNIKVVNNCMKGSLIKIISIQDYSDLNEEDESSNSKNELDEMLGSESDIDSEDQQYEASNIFSDGICDDLDGIKFSDMRVFDKVRPELEKSYFELKINRKKKCINKQIACSILTENKPVLSNDRLACVIQK